MTATTQPSLVTRTGVWVGQFEVGSPDWHAARAGGLGGSEIAAVLGLSKWDSRFSLWHRKAGNIGAQPVNEEMEAGTRFEDAICQKFADNHPEFLVQRTGTFRHVDRPWQIANPDRLIFQRELCPVCQESGWHGGQCTCPTGPVAALETKFAMYADEWGPADSDEVPPYYLAQARWYLDVLGLDVIYLQVFFGSSAEFREYTIKADDADQTLMRDAARDFLDDVAAGVRPDIDAHKATYQTVRALHPQINGEDAEISPELADQYQQACDGYKAAEANKRLAVSQLLDAMGDARRAVCAGQPIAIRVPGHGDAAPHLRPTRARKDQA